jgi:alkanesulfonate monooxygenase SsuD/methylene tetrahydromethanopterin reductase-like flavin-dependent oxidoreductase (luciferase family)
MPSTNTSTNGAAQPFEPLRVGILTAATLGPRARALVTLAADAGLDHVGTIDHVCFQGTQGVDGMVTAALLAGAHPTLPLHIGVYQLPVRHPVVGAPPQRHPGP